jgi:TRAP-type C4-dicarboxylate transport system permease small subunit
MMSGWMNIMLMLSGFVFLLIMGALCVMLLIKTWTNQIDLSSLLDEANGDASMSRFQLLVFSLVVAVGVFLFILKNLTLPDIPQSILTLLGISASTYAAGKGISFSRPEGVIKPSKNGPAQPVGNAGAGGDQSVG